MKLYVTPTSVYARLARIIVIEKGLEDRVEVIPAQTRRAGSPYYDINVSGRVPFLLRDDGIGMEGSELICAYLDHVDGNPEFEPPAYGDEWEYHRLLSRARSFLDGLSVWVREIKRPEEDRSATVIAHEKERSRRLADAWESDIAHPLLAGGPNMIGFSLVGALQMEQRLPDFDWRDGHPRLVRWEAELAERPSLARTVPSAPL